MKNYKIIKKAISLSIAVSLISFIAFIVLEPIVTNATTTVTDTAKVTATVTQEVTISSPPDTTFSASIPGITGNAGSPATASLSWKIITNDSTGFDLKLSASQVNALYKDGSYYFTDYGTPPTPTYGWSGPASGSASFGFTINAATPGDTVAAFQDGGVSCGAGGGTGACWAGFNGTNQISIIHRTTLTSASGETEIVNFKAESNAKYLASGDYAATITATASIN